ncbi:glycosyltransferase family 2 protein [Clostridium perfringens]|uniref:glycosyltransferase family 2 protein n=1 Tax=Clostridium perfringens TaxID=1502 RepID=UPI0018E49AFA|nr:glycosyltransferase family 2 protein [Clostridium perfringens]ELC8453850.1 glycosyltransferase family 2 protein [Clostridium perfringens]ELC8454938.1 glycosyltransferase family 2 protein [Clostridium perfringens]MBI6074869.1 glycosyltransferase family 2 protein [Clostridium perfringens]QUD73579.1 glycosyltransferase family 2 protein [Clostridium perfringens]
MNDISIVIPTKNRSLFLEECISSFKKYNGKIEIIVVDDGSDNINREKNRKICKNYNVKYILNEFSLGAPKSRNIGMRNSSGKYIWFFDDDDIVNCKAITDVIELINNSKSNSIIILPMIVVLNNKEVIFEINPQKERNNFESYRKNGQEVSTSCAIFPKVILEKIGGWDEKLVSGQDTDLFLRASEVSNIQVLSDTLPIEIRVGHIDRISVNVKKQQIGKIQFMRKNWSRLHLKRKIYYMVTFVLCTPYFRKIKYNIMAFRKSKLYKEDI